MFLHTYQKHVSAVILLLLITVIAYYPSLGHEFLNWDDNSHLTDNLAVRSLQPQNIIQNIFGKEVNKTYIPLTTLSFAIEYYFFGYNPFVYHLDNLLLHILVVVLIFCFALQLQLSFFASWLAALLFAIHPMHVESVAWVTERKDVLYASFYLLALLAYGKHLKTNAWKFFWLTWFLGFLSMLAKPMAFSLPFILILYDWFYFEKLRLKMLIVKAPFVLYVAPMALITFSLNIHRKGFNLSEIFLSSVWTFVFYLKKFLFPLTLIPIYPTPKPVNWTNIELVSAVVIFLVILGLIFVWRKYRWLVFAFGFYFLSIMLLIHYDILGVFFVADRFMYLPSLGFCLWFGLALDRLRLKISSINNSLGKNIFYLGLAIFYLLLFLKTHDQTKVWQNSFTFWNYIIEHNPTLNLAYINRGDIYLKEGKYELALSDLNRAVNLNPNYNKAYNNRGTIYKQLKQYDLAIADFDKTLKLNPQNIKAFINRGDIYRLTKRYDLSLSEFQKALELDPKSEQVLNNRALVYFEQGRFEEALEDFNRALFLNPDYSFAYYNRAIYYKTIKDFPHALADFLKARALGFKIPDGELQKLQLLIVK